VFVLLKEKTCSWNRMEDSDVMYVFLVFEEGLGGKYTWMECIEVCLEVDIEKYCTADTLKARLLLYLSFRSEGPSY
jgi:hypothetical protein